MKHSTAHWFIPSLRPSDPSYEWGSPILKQYVTTMQQLIELLKAQSVAKEQTAALGTDNADDITDKVRLGQQALGGQTQLEKLEPRDALKKLRDLLNSKSLSDLDIQKAYALLVTYDRGFTRSRVKGNPNGGYVDRKTTRSN